MKIRPVGDELLFANRRTDMTKLVVAFRNFANAPKNVKKMLTVFVGFRCSFVVLKLLMFFNITCKVIIHADL